MRTKSGGGEKFKTEIQRTVEIAYKGKTSSVPVQDERMTELSKLILGGEESADDFHLEIVGESSIHGDEDNFIDLGDTDFLGSIGVTESTVFE